MKKKAVIGILAVAAFALVGLFVFNGVRRAISLDNCLDSGGAWDYRTEDCRH